MLTLIYYISQTHLISFFTSRHDTSLKIWNANTYEEIFSLGGHTGRISAILLISENKAVTGSQDCSIRFWEVKRGALNFCSVFALVCLFKDSSIISALGRPA